MTAQLTLVLGGIASGKSAHGETLARASGQSLIYLATAEALDGEMQAKIARHRALRAEHGWQTVEIPRDVAAWLPTTPAGHTVLLDCATMWLSNHLLADSDIAAETARLITALAASPAEVIAISNEVGLSGVPENALARQFANAQGHLNQTLAAHAARVDLVTAGLAQTLKGGP